MPCFLCRGHRFNPWLETKISHTGKKKKKRLLYLLQQRRHQRESVWTSKQLNSERGESQNIYQGKRNFPRHGFLSLKVTGKLVIKSSRFILGTQRPEIQVSVSWAETYLICFHLQHQLSRTLSHCAFSEGLGTRSYGFITCCCEISNVSKNIGLPSTLFTVPEGKSLISAQLSHLQVCIVRCCELLLLYSVQPHLHFCCSVIIGSSMLVGKINRWIVNELPMKILLIIMLSW